MGEKITDKQAKSIIFLTILGSSIVSGTARAAKENEWISIIFAIIISLIIVLCYGRLLSNFRDKNFFEICKIVFGKFIGSIFILLYIWYALYTNALAIRHLGEFIYIIGIVNIRKISQIVTMGIAALLSIYMVKKKLFTFGRFCTFFLPVVVFMLLIGYILSINNMSPRNLLPIAYDGPQPIIKGMLTAIDFPFTQSIVFIMIFSSLKGKPSKIFTRGVLSAGLLLLVISLCNIMILDPYTLSSAYFPTYSSFRRISIGNFLERIEITIILSFIFGVFVSSTCFLIAACKGIACIFNLKDYTSIATPVGLLVVSIAYLLYENIKELLESPGIVVVDIFFQIVLFFVVFIGTEIKVKRKKKLPQEHP